MQVCETVEPDRIKYPFGVAPPKNPPCLKGSDKSGFLVLERDLGSVRIPPIVAWISSVLLFGLGAARAALARARRAAGEGEGDGPRARPGDMRGLTTMRRTLALTLAPRHVVALVSGGPPARSSSSTRARRATARAASRFVLFALTVFIIAGGAVLHGPHPPALADEADEAPPCLDESASGLGRDGSSVRSMSASVWARRREQRFVAAGARYTPRSSSPWNNAGARRSAASSRRRSRAPSCREEDPPRVNARGTCASTPRPSQRVAQAVREPAAVRSSARRLAVELREHGEAGGGRERVPESVPAWYTGRAARARPSRGAPADAASGSRRRRPCRRSRGRA
jgi:hypothetical protein